MFNVALKARRKTIYENCPLGFQGWQLEYSVCDEEYLEEHGHTTAMHYESVAFGQVTISTCNKVDYWIPCE